MGWWWNSEPASAEQVQSIQATPIEIESNPAAVFVAEKIKKPLSREEQSELDLLELLKEFQIEEEKAKGQRIKSRESGVLSQTVPIPADISPDSLYPTELSCRSALDYAMFCQSFGGQFVNVYRYGSFRSCSNHWQDFWLCMRTRNWDEKERTKAIQDHYRSKAIKYKTGPSSEAIWEVRSEPVKDAFQENLEELEAKIKEWQQANPGVPDPWAKQQGATFNRSGS